MSLSADERLAVMGAAQRPATVFALDFAQRALRASQIQLRRIYQWEERTASFDEIIAINEERLTDIHFLFIAIRNVYRYLRKVGEVKSGTIAFRTETPTDPAAEAESFTGGFADGRLQGCYFRRYNGSWSLTGWSARRPSSQ